MEERYLSLSEAADALHISERTAYRWISSGKLRAYKPGRDYRIPESAVKEAVKGSEVLPKGESRSSLEPSLFYGLENGRHSPILADAIVAAAKAWRATVEDPDINIHKRFGFRDAAIELFDRVSDRLVGTLETLPLEERNEIMLAMKELFEIPEEAYRAMPDETLKESNEERRRKIRRWTEQISA